MNKLDFKGDQPSPAQNKTPGVLTSLPFRLLLVVCIAQFALLMLIFWIDRTNSSKPAVPRNPAQKASAAVENEPYVWNKPGPWGNLRFVRIVIEPPDEFVPTEKAAFPKTRWFFGGYSRAQLTNLFQTADLSASQRTALMSPTVWHEDTNGLSVVPDAVVVLGMNPSARAQIYTVLSQDGRNMFQAWPYTFRTGGFDQWFIKGGVDASTVTLLRSLLYTRGASLCFSDLPEVFATISSTEERRQLIKTLSRNSTLLVKLHVAPDSNIKALTDYWTGLWAAKDIGPLLESLTDIPGGMTIDIAHLMPPFARKRLNTYPIPDKPNRWPDCYWSSFNFFNDPPDDRYYDQTFWSNVLKTDYTPVFQPSFGDLIFLLQTNGVPVHAAVYIADDVVFTKNGGNYRQPWILMKWEDLIARYPDNASLHTLYFRSNKSLKRP